MAKRATSSEIAVHAMQETWIDQGIRDPGNPHESHDHEGRQTRTLQKRLPIPFEIVINLDSELVFSLRSKQRFRKAHLEAAR